MRPSLTPMINPTRTRTLAAASAVLAALVLGACGKAPETQGTAGQKVDETIAKVERKAEEVKADAKQAGAEMKADAKAAGAEISADAKQASTDVKAAMSDAAITAAVNAELARDKDLSALKINVDTSGGRVLLKGEAPTADARERATRLAQAVRGVRAVDNQLNVKG